MSGASSKRSAVSASGRLPASAREVHPARVVETHPFSLEEIALHVGPEAIAMAAATGGADDPLPGHAVQLRTVERAERHADRTRRPWPSGNRCHLPVGHDASPWDASHDAIDDAVEERRAGGAAARRSWSDVRPTRREKIAPHGRMTTACAGASSPAHGPPSPTPSLAISTMPCASTRTTSPLKFTSTIRLSVPAARS